MVYDFEFNRFGFVIFWNRGFFNVGNNYGSDKIVGRRRMSFFEVCFFFLGMEVF